VKKPRPDSLYARLAAADPSLELREWVFYAALIEAKSFEEIGGHLHDKGVITSAAGIGQMIQRHSLRWKLDKSTERAQSLDGWKPDKKKGSLAEQIKQNLRKQIFNASMTELSVAEMVALHRSLTAEQVAMTGLYSVQQRGAEFVGELLKDEAKAAELRALAKDGQMSAAQYIEAVRQRMYADAAAPLPGKEAGA